MIKDPNFKYNEQMDPKRTTKFRRYPAKSGDRIAATPRKLVSANITIRNSGSKVSIKLFNRTGSPSMFWISGVFPEVGVELEGNKTYTVDLPTDPDAICIQVYEKSPRGKLLAEQEIPGRSLDTNDEHNEEIERPLLAIPSSQSIDEFRKI